MSKRRFVKVARMRLADVVEGDIVNRNPDSEEGWFAVAKKHRLFNGDVQLSDGTADLTVSGADFELVGVQFVSETEIPDQPPVPERFLIFNDGSEPDEKDPGSPDSDESGAEGDHDGGHAEAEPVAEPIVAAH